MIINVKELKSGRNELSFEIPADRFATYLEEVDELYVDPGSPCVVEMIAERFEESLFLRGHLEAPLAFDCARCLARLEQRWRHDFRWTLFPHDSLEVQRLSEQEEIELSEDDLDVSFYEGEEIDLEALARELILLEIEYAPSCGLSDCPNLEDIDSLITQEEAEKRVDPRWEKLASIKKQLTDSSENS